VGADGLLVSDPKGLPVLATMGEKLGIILLSKAGSLLPGGGLWLHTQRPEWNDANNALVGNGLSVVTLAHLRRFLQFLLQLPVCGRSFELSAPTLRALQDFLGLVRATPLAAVDHAVERRASWTEPEPSWIRGATLPTKRTMAASWRVRPKASFRTWRTACCRWWMPLCSGASVPMDYSTVTTWSGFPGTGRMYRRSIPCSRVRSPCFHAAFCL